MLRFSWRDAVYLVFHSKGFWALVLSWIFLVVVTHAFNNETLCERCARECVEVQP